MELKKYASLVAALASFLTPFMGSAINLAIPSIGKQFGGSAYLLGWVATCYLLAAAAFLVPLGRLADIRGRKKIFALGLGVFLVSSLLCGAAWSMETLLIFRVCQGIGGAMIFGTAVAILTSVYSPRERGRVLGLNSAAVYTGLSLGPVLGGALNHNLGWRSIFYFTALLAFVVLALTITRLKGEWAGARGEKFDLPGAVLYTAGLVALLTGVSSFTASGGMKYLLIPGLVILAGFVKYAVSNVDKPVLDLKLFAKNMTFAFSNLAALINYSATFAVTFLLSLYLQVVVGYDSQTAGFVLLSQPALMAVLSPFAGTLSDRVEPRIVASLGMALITCGLLIFSFLNGGTSLWLIVGNLILLGVGFALFASPNTNAVMGAVDKKFYGIASSTLSTMRLTGQAFSMAIVTLLLAHYIGGAELSHVSTGLLVKSTKTAFAVFTVICCGGVFASLTRGKVNVGAER